MSTAPVRRSDSARQRSALVRGAQVNAGAQGVQRVVRPSVGGLDSSDDDWVVVEPEADIAAKGHPYVSFDPAGTYP